jgi:fused signal recognition particle receptor
MGFLSKFKNIFSKKKISEKITQQNETNSFVKQEKFDKGLKHSSSSLNNTLNQIGSKYRTLNQELIDAIEEALISYDIGYSSTKKILNSIVEEIKLQNVTSPELIKEIIVDKLFVYYIQNANTDNGLNIKDGELNVILVVGVNGVGKTTSIAKLTNFFVKQGKKVCLIAGDTFRAGAVEQLSI